MTRREPAKRTPDRTQSSPPAKAKPAEQQQAAADRVAEPQAASKLATQTPAANPIRTAAHVEPPTPMVAEHAPPRAPAAAPSSSPAAVGKKRILMVSHMPPFPPRAGNEQHLFRMLRWMKEQGYEVIYVLYPHEPLRDEDIAAAEKLVARLHILPKPTRASELGRYAGALLEWNRIAVQELERRNVKPPWPLLRARFEWLENNWCPHPVAEAVETLVRQYRPQVVMAQYVFFTRVLRNLPPEVLRIVDTHDLFSQRKQSLRNQRLSEDFIAMTAEEEAFALSRADVIMTSQEDEAQGIRDFGLQQRVFTIAIDMEVRPPLRSDEGTPGQVLIVGSSNELNLRGVRGFVEITWPLIRKRHPEARLRIVGSVAERLREQPGTLTIDDSVELVGYVPELESEYRNAQVVVNPTYLGSGLKIKTVEALAHGKPLVVWGNGLTGMGTAAPCLVGTHWLDIARMVNTLLETPEMRQQLSAQAVDYVRARYAQEVIYKPLKEVIERGTAR